MSEQAWASRPAAMGEGNCYGLRGMVEGESWDAGLSLERVVALPSVKARCVFDV